MKKKLTRILGVGLTIVLLTSLIVMATPASASTLSWGAEDNPADEVEWNIGLVGTNIVDIAANGDTVFAATNNITEPLFKSIDGGMTWTSLATSDDFPASVSVISVAVAVDN
ncbi:hypothetical protein ACFLTR_04925, partial [Chloroflexota bacterium]